MDRVTQLRGEPGGSSDSTLDTTSAPSEAFLTANDTSKYFSLSEEDSAFDISPIKDVSLANTAADCTEPTLTGPDQLISNLSPIPKSNDLLDTYKIGKHIEAANILSGGVDIFDDNDNSYDGDELVIDDNAGVDLDDKSNPEAKLVSKENQSSDDSVNESTLLDGETAIPSKDAGVVLQIDGKNVDAIDIGNGLYLYRREDEQEELAAVQIVDTDKQQPSFKFLKVRVHAEGKLEVYEEIEVEVPKETPSKGGKPAAKSMSHLPIKDINKVITDPSNKAIDRKKLPPKEIPKTSTPKELKKSTSDSSKAQVDSKSEVNFNGKTMKFNEARKSPLIGSFTSMTYHSSPNKEGIALTKTMVDMQLHPNRHSDNVKKTIEVNTESCKPKLLETPTENDNFKDKNVTDNNSSKTLKEGVDKASDKESVVVKDKIIDSTQKEVITSKQSSKEKNTEQESSSLLKPLERTNPNTDKETTNIKQDAEKGLDITEILENVGGDELSSVIENNSSKVIIDVIKQADLKKVEADAYSKDAKCTMAEETKLEPNVDQDRTTEAPKMLVSEKDPASLKQNLIDNEQPSKGKECKKNMSSHEVEETKQIEVADKTNKVETNASIQEDIVNTDTNQEITNICTNKDIAIKNTKPTSEAIIPKNSKISLMAPATTTISPGKEHSADGKTKSPNHDSGTSSKNTSNELIELNDLGIEVVKDKVPDLIPDAYKTDLKNISSEGDNFVAISSKFETERNIAKVETVTNRFGYSKVAEPNSTSIKTEAKSSVATNEFVSKYVSKALIIKSDTNSTFDAGKNNEKTNSNQNITNLRTDASSYNALEKSEQISQVVDKKDIPQVSTQMSQTVDKKDIPRVSTPTDTKPKSINNNAVPFGKWTEANKQEYLIKIKETKVTSNNTNQIKQTNDLNRRDVLKKFDSQRQINTIAAAAKTQELANLNKDKVKTEKPSFVSKASVKQDVKIPVKSEAPGSKDKNKSGASKLPLPNPSSATITKNEPVAPSSAPIEPAADPGPQLSTQSLIDRTIEDILMDRRPPPKFNHESAMRQNPLAGKSLAANDKAITSSAPKNSSSKDKKVMPLDDIEMKMNELHGIPFIERPLHELPLPPRYNKDVKTYSRTDGHSKVLPMSKVNKIPPLVPLSNKQQAVKTLKNDDTDDLSDEDIIEHEPITGDIDLQKRKVSLSQQTARLPISQTVTSRQATSLKDDSVITENEFDKFARRNSKTYENCITVNFESNKQHNVVQGIVEKELAGARKPRSLLHTEPNQQHRRHLPNMTQNKPQIHSSRFLPINTEEEYNKNYQSKLQIAYQTAMTAKKHKESTITVIEDKPVKVVFMDANSEYVPGKLNVQGQELSPTKKYTEPDAVTLSSCDSLDSEVIETVEELKSQDNTKKSKHQRKQVLTPVETPEMELIEPNKCGSEASSKKKRKTEDFSEKSPKSVLPKKTYLLGRAVNLNENETFNNSPKEHVSRREHTTASAIDSLVKAAELLENQSEKLNASRDTQNSPQTPVKRGRGRPRKYPLPEGVVDKTKAPSPQKKTRLERKTSKPDTSSEEETTDEEMVRENWTMGKINENIVCPICNKLFRSENVVFKHVKHCTGPSPSRSDSGDKRSPRRGRRSQDLSYKSSHESQSEDMDSDSDKSEDIPLSKKIVSKDEPKEKQVAKTSEEVIVIEDTSIKTTRVSEKRENAITNSNDIRKTQTKLKKPLKSNDLSCEICGKTFRQLSYLASHRMQHNNDELKVNETQSASKSVFSCEVCKKEFRKLHHLVQHRIIHNPQSMPFKLRRKSSAEHSESKNKNNTSFTNKIAEDQSAGFRCEPCDKSFRKLHHLVEHRETHDGINRQKNSTTDKPTQNVVDKGDAPPPQCDICKKTFRKLHHLIEHKEQHVEDNSEKPDNKSNKSALSTKDIIHECSLCYMVFPNEHSLNKHTVNCQKKKRQSASKPAKPDIEDQTSQESTVSVDLEDSITKAAVVEKIPEKIEQKDTVVNIDNTSKRKKSDAVPEQQNKPDPIPEQQRKSVNVVEQNRKTGEVMEQKIKSVAVLDHTNKSDDSLDLKNKPEEKNLEKVEVTEQYSKVQPTMEEIKPVESLPVKKDAMKTKKPIPETKPSSDIGPIKRKKSLITETVVIDDTPNKRNAVKDTTVATVTKRQKTAHLPPPVVDDDDQLTSDDDDVRYMLSPNFNPDKCSESKIFMKIRANKRNSLQIERSNSKDPIKRRILLQHPSKVPRLKPKTEEQSTLIKSKAIPKEPIAKTLAVEPVPSLDSDDSDVKYSFPKSAPEKPPKSASKLEAPPKETVKKTIKKSLAERRKSLVGIAKRKSLGRPMTPRQKPKSAPTTQVKKRIAEIGHRCDCGQLFNSAALLSRHTTLAHTPPRIRRRRSPLPSPEIKKSRAPLNDRTVTKASKPVDTRKSSVKSDDNSSKATNSRKSSVKSDVDKPVAKLRASTSSRLSPPPASEEIKKPRAPLNDRTITKASKPVHTRKSSVKSDAKSSNKATNSRKSSVKSDVDKPDAQLRASTSSKTPKTPGKAKPDTSKTDTTTPAESRAKLRRSAAHRGVPVPEKMRKILEKISK